MRPIGESVKDSRTRLPYPVLGGMGWPKGWPGRARSLQLDGPRPMEFQFSGGHVGENFQKVHVRSGTRSELSQGHAKFKGCMPYARFNLAAE